MRFKEKTIVVTGAGSGIGKQITYDLVHEGATVYAIGRTEEKLASLKRSSSLITNVCDISIPEDVTKLFEHLKKEGHAVTGLVNNAGINPSRNVLGNTSFDDWEKTIATNLTGVFNCSKAALEHMISVGAGSIVNISSIAGICALKERASYMSSKWGLVGLTQSIAIDYAKHNIRANCVCPGYVETPLVENYLSALSDDEHEALKKSHALGRFGSIHDIARAVLFLLSDDSSWITGVTLPVDGGYHIGRTD